MSFGKQREAFARPDRTGFDYQVPAEMFMTKARLTRRPPITYRRFDTAAEAIRFAIEEVPASLLAGVVLEVDGARFDHAGIHQLYANSAYPLTRPALA